MIHKTIMKMLEDPYRDRLVLNLLKELLADSHNVYIFYCYKSITIPAAEIVFFWNDLLTCNKNEQRVYICAGTQQMQNASPDDRARKILSVSILSNPQLNRYLKKGIEF